MSLYENVSCPVCKRVFQEDDAIVTCPECGTPHHKECYDLIGRCVNAGLHKADYDFFANEIKPAKADVEENIPKEDNAESNPFYNKEKSPFGLGGFIPVIDSGYENDSDTIDGESVADFAAVIKTNIESFIHKFKKLDKSKKSLSWNWGSFFFGSFYMLFRKMYKQGIAFLCLFISMIYACSALFYKLAPVFTKNMMDLVASGNGNPNSITTEQMDMVLNSSDADMANKITYLFFAVLFVVRIIEALITDRMYKNNVSSIIKKVKKQLENGATFMQTSLFEGKGENLTQLQMRRLYLSRRGGVSLEGPILAMLMLSFFLIM